MIPYEAANDEHRPELAAEGSCHDDEFSSLLGNTAGNSLTDVGAVRLEEDCLPVGVVAEAVEATARARAEALRKRSAELAREVLARAEQDVRELLAQGLAQDEFAAQSAEIVARADREVRQILAQGRTDAAVVEMRAGQQAAELRAHAVAMAGTSPDPLDTDAADPDGLPDPLLEGTDPDPWQEHVAQAMLVETPALVVDETPSELFLDEPRESEAPTVEVLVASQAVAGMTAGGSPSEPCFATLRAAPLPTENGVVRYRVTGALTFATMLAFEQAVSRLPGVSSASVTPEPDDVAVLKLTTSDASLIAPLLVCMPGIQLQIEAA
jgi:hypothetical protein